MAMFDNFVFHGKSPCTCAAGHEMRGVFQTKDLDCDLSTYHVVDASRIFYEAAGVRDVKLNPFGLGRVGDRDVLLMGYERQLPACDFTTEVVIYDRCEQCDPVCYVGNFNDRILHRYPFCEFLLTIDAGYIMAVDNFRRPTLEEIRSELLLSVDHVLPDTDARVQRHIESLRRGQSKHR